MTKFEEKLLAITQESMHKVFKDTMEGYNSPLSVLAKEVVESHKEELRKLFDSSFSAVILTKEFKKSVKEAFLHKIARVLVSDLTGFSEKAITVLKSDPTFKARMILAIEDLVTREMKMTNHEERRDFKPSVHMVMAFNKSADKANPPVIRRVVHKSLHQTLRTFRPMLQAMGGEWRIHHTVNARDTEKARVHLLCKLIENPDKACSIDIEWRTSLLQRHCIYGEKRWMLDVDEKKSV